MTGGRVTPVRMLGGAGEEGGAAGGGPAGGGAYCVFADGGGPAGEGLAGAGLAGGGLATGGGLDGPGVADRPGVADALLDVGLGAVNLVDSEGLRWDINSAEETAISTSPAAMETAAKTAGVVRYHGARGRLESASPKPSAAICLTIPSTYSAKSSS